ncbi:nuclease-related domain-containing protein [Rossellomorea oryzaecorticis]|uniref:Nuclease-related domain-containing protein n=1 Tax=Rossellomorea oryzaecorticis TaxID=1396505 RepID=A0ABU9K4S5_9BACI
MGVVMAIYKGKEELIKNLHESRRPQDQAGLEAEIKVGDLLSKSLPSDTYVIAQPEIGVLEPDFLIVSPKYGFRIVEVKNLKMQYIDKVLSNGGLITKYKNSNPFTQVKSHGQGLKNYLLSNHPRLSVSDPYRLIGYCVVHAGFTRRDFEYKFNSQLIKWTEKERKEYFKYHYFLEDLYGHVDLIMNNATKFRPRHLLGEQELHEIVSNLKISPSKKVDDEYIDFIEQNEKIAQVNKELEEVKESIQLYNINNVEASTAKTKTKAVPIFLLSIVLAALIIWFFNPDLLKVLGGDHTTDTESTIIEELSFNENQIGDYVKVQASVERFYFDADSGTKFLTMTDGKQSLDAVIFKGTKVPYIHEGDELVFEGYIQSSRGLNGVELKVTGIE